MLALDIVRALNDESNATGGVFGRFRVGTPVLGIVCSGGLGMRRQMLHL